MLTNHPKQGQPQWTLLRTSEDRFAISMHGGPRRTNIYLAVDEFEALVEACVQFRGQHVRTDDAATSPESKAVL